MAIASSDIHELVEIVGTATGFRIKDAASPDVKRAVDEAMSARGLEDWAAYRDHLLGDPEEIVRLGGALSVKETYFFRSPAHFRFLREVLERELIPKRLAEGFRGHENSIEIWSAGCSTGEEAHSIAAVAAAALNGRNGVEVRVRATDLSDASMRIARRGFYPHARLAEGADDLGALLSDEPVRDGGPVQVRDAAMRLLTFGIHNVLRDPLPVRCDAVFCRNVMIYMDAEHQRQLVARLHDALRPGGLLFLGDAELLHVMPHEFDTQYLDGAVVYRKRVATGVGLHE